MKVNRIPTHPGDVLKEELEVRGISQKQFSLNTGIPYSTLNEILNGKRPVTSGIALIVEAALGLNPEMLVAMQNRYDMSVARQEPATLSNLEKVRRLCASWLL
ncbi:MAG: HigA family addiction module antidote protein [Prevotella sp.]|nr:HigA family addiction module antidote protein [Prevotella sp.]